MKNTLYLFYCILLVLNFKNSDGQTFPIVVNNTPLTGVPLGIRCSPVSASFMAQVQVGESFVASAVINSSSTATSTYNGQPTNYFYQIDLPGVSAGVTGYVAAGSTFTNPICNADYITVGSVAVNVRPSAGDLTNHVYIGGVSSAFALVFPGQKFAVAGTSTVSGVIWYGIYLPAISYTGGSPCGSPNYCSQSIGWVNGSLVTHSISGTNGLPTPISLTSSSPTTSGASLSWIMNYYPYSTAFDIINTSTGSIITTDFNIASSPFTPIPYTISILSACTGYTLQVRANQGSCISNNSGTTSFTTSCCAPSSPSISSATSSTATSFTAHWTFVGSATSYSIEVSNNSSFTSILGSYNNLNVGNVNSYPITGLSCGNTYYYRVKAINGCGASSPSSFTTGTTSSCCIPPANPTVHTPSGQTANSFFANWIGVSGLDYYVDVSSNSLFTVYSTYYGGHGISSTNIYSLSCGSTYYYRVWADNGSCYSGYSSTMPASTSLCCSLPSSTTPTYASSVNSSAFVAHWNPSSGATNYLLDVATNSSFTSFVPGYNNRSVGNIYSIAVTGLANNTTYYYRVWPTNGCGTGSSAGYISLTTNAAMPNMSYVIQQGYPMCVAADPIDIATGSYSSKHTDLKVKTINASLNFTRYYNSVNNSLNSALGYGWSHSFDYYIANYADTLWTVHYGDGHSSSFIPLYLGANSSYALFGGTYETLSKDPSTGLFSLTFKSGEVYSFNSNKRLATITDLNGNVTTLNYTSGNLTSITGPGGRSLTLSYSGSNVSAITDPLGRTVSYNYDGNGNLISVTDPNSHTTGITYYSQHYIWQITTARGYTLLENVYDGSGRVITQSDALGLTTSIAYNTPVTGDATITYPGGSTSVVHHDSYYRLTQQTDELGHIKTLAYDLNNNLVSALNENSNLTTYAYDNLGNCLNIAQPLSTSTSLYYNSFNKPTSVIDALGHTTNLSYDGNGNIIQADLPNGSSRYFTYYTNGLLHTSTDGLSHVTTYNYNSFGDLTSIVSPTGTKTFTRDAAGRLLSVTDENSHTTSFVYSNTDKTILITDPRGATTIDSFDADDNLIAATDKNGHTTNFVYDVKDQLTTVVDALGRTKTIAYDIRDNIHSVTDANGHIVSYGYDAKKRLISKTNATGTIQWVYDYVGNITSAIDALGNTTNFSYNALNQRTAITDALGRNTSYTYNPLGLLASITSPSGRTTGYIYNEIGFVTQVNDAAGHSTYVTYNANGKKISLTDANGHTQLFGYDASSRLTSTHDAANNLDSFILDAVGNVTQEIKPTGSIINTYDAANNLTDVVNSTGDSYHYVFDSAGLIRSMTNGSGTGHFFYDSVNQLKQYTDVFGNVVMYSYDSVGNKKSITYPGGNVVNYAYNADNSLKSVTDWLGNTTNYFYDANSRPKQMQYSNGATCNYAYSVAGELDSQTTVVGSTIISQCIPTLNLNSERIYETRIGAVPKHFVKDSFINSYLPNDALVSDGYSNYSNDGAGNRTSETNVSGTTSYAFTVGNILNSITTPSTTTTFHYDALGFRVARTKAGVGQRFVNDPSGRLVQVLMEQNNAGVTKASYIYGLGLIARIDSSGGIQWYHFDPQHNTVALSDGSGHVTDTYAYLSSGKMVSHSGNTQQPYTFLGEFGAQQETSSFYFLRARYYDARQAGRFISKDPYPGSIDNPQTLNRYVYGLNNSVSVYDPSGFCSETNPIGHADLQFEIARTGPLEASVSTTSLAKINLVLASINDRNPNQDKKLTSDDIKKLKDDDWDHSDKGKRGGQSDLYKDKEGNVYEKPKGGAGPGEPIGKNLNDLSKSTVNTGVGIGIGVVFYEMLKWGAAIFLTPESAGFSLVAAGAAP